MNHPKEQERLLEIIHIEAKKRGHYLSPFYSETYEETMGAKQHACCQRCGARLTLGGDLEVLSVPCQSQGNRLRAIESQAWLIGISPQLLLERLEQELEELPPDIARFFDPGDFDPDNEELVSNDGIWRLKWLLRDQDNLPIGEDNPQSPTGMVELQRMVADKRLFPARYIGPRLNPNISDDPELWIVQPLEPNTLGLAYRVKPMSGPVYWCFRRSQGVTGHYVPYEALDFELTADQVQEVNTGRVETPPQATVQDPEVTRALYAASDADNW